jgi:hypothetical protein
MSEDELNMLLAVFPSWVVIRPRRIKMYYGTEHPVGSGAINNTLNDMKKTVTWTDTTSTKIGFSIKRDIEASFMEMFKTSMSISFSMEWTTEKSFSDSYEITIPPKHHGWLTRLGMTTTAEADIIGINHLSGPKAWYRYAEITGYAGNDGRPDSWINANVLSNNSRMVQAFTDTQKGLPEGLAEEEDGALVVPSVLLALISASS